MRLDPFRSFSKDIDRIPDGKIRERLMQVLLHIEQARTLTDILNLKKLKGHPSAYRIRVGDYRLCFFLRGNTIELVRFLNRRDVYRVFP